MPSLDEHETSDQRLDQALGNLLRGGVILAATVTFLGGIAYVMTFWDTRSDHHILVEQSKQLRKPVSIVRCALTLDERCVIQLGLLLLIATPITRVAFSVIAFARQRDWTFVVITLVVLGLLLYGLLRDT
jgi:uncharacterized membrane protein